MELDLNLVPDIVRHLALPLTGGAFPKADPADIVKQAQLLESLADRLADVRTEDAEPVLRLLRGEEWQGDAKEAFEKVFTRLSGVDDGTEVTGKAFLEQIEEAIRAEAASLRDHGVRMEHTQWMIYASLAMLAIAIMRLLVWVYVNGPAVFALIQKRILLTRMSIDTFKRQILASMLKFGALMGGLDVGVQGAQHLWGHREDWDVGSLLLSTGSGALAGAVFGGLDFGLSRLLSREMVYVASRGELALRDQIAAVGQSLYGRALLGGVAGVAGAVPGLAMSDKLDSSHLFYSFVSGVAGGVDVPAAARVTYHPAAAAELSSPATADAPSAARGAPPADAPAAGDAPPALPRAGDPSSPHSSTDPAPPSRVDHTTPAPTAEPRPPQVFTPEPVRIDNTTVVHPGPAAEARAGDNAPNTASAHQNGGPVIRGEVVGRTAPEPLPAGETGHGAVGQAPRAPHETAPATSQANGDLPAVRPHPIPERTAAAEPAGTPDHAAPARPTPPLTHPPAHPATQENVVPHVREEPGGVPKDHEVARSHERGEDRPRQDAPEPARQEQHHAPEPARRDQHHAPPVTRPGEAAAHPTYPSDAARPVMSRLDGATNPPEAPSWQRHTAGPDAISRTDSPVPVMPGDHSPIAGSRPRNPAEAAALVHRWTPPDGDGEPYLNRVEESLSPDADHARQPESAETPPGTQEPPPSATHPPLPHESARTAMEHRRELMTAVRAEAERRGTTALEELQQWAIQRALARVFIALPEAWMIKGGQAMKTRYDDARSSSDIDLTRIDGDHSPEVMESGYLAALERDHGDGLRFVLESKETLRFSTARLKHTVYLGDMELMTLGADLNPPRGAEAWETVPFPREVYSPGSVAYRPDLRVTSLFKAMLDKIAGMWSQGVRTHETKCNDCIPYRDNLFSCRSASVLPQRAQDLVDVLFLARKESWNAAEIHRKLHEEFAWRLTDGRLEFVPDHFYVPNPDWPVLYPQMAQTAPGLPIKTLDEAVPLAKALLDPLLGPEPPDAVWSPEKWSWVGREHEQDTAPATFETSADRPVEVASVRRIESTGRAEPSRFHADPEKIELWDALASEPHHPGSLDARLRQLLERTNLSLDAKHKHVRNTLMHNVGYEPTLVRDLDSKNLRIYSHQSGEVNSHAAALILDPDTTIEIAYQPQRGWNTFRWEAHQSHVAHLDAVPQGMTVEQANAVAMWRASKGLSVHDVPHDVLARDLLDLNAHPLREALATRRTLIEDYGIAPHRIRLAYADHTQQAHIAATRWERANIFALEAVRADPDGAREALVNAMRGPAEVAALREARARAVAERLHAAFDQAGSSRPQKYSMLWVRDTRDRPVGARQVAYLDTRPEILRQVIESVRADHPDRRIALVGDDIFARRPELRAAWEREGVLDGVDSSTMVNFWDASRNGGRPLSRAEQGLAWHRLNTETDMIHVGMESGILELPMMLGVRTVYLSFREHVGNKGDRWLLYWQPWARGQTEVLQDQNGAPRLDPAGKPMTVFRHSGEASPPVDTVERVLMGPDLPDPANRQAQAEAVHLAAKVSMTADRIYRLIERRELDHWPRRLGRSTLLDGTEWQPWTEADWARSRYYAEQLHHWARAEVSTPEEAGRKWDAIRLALNGLLEPNFHIDHQYDGASEAHPYFFLHADPALTREEMASIREAYAQPPDERGAAVTQVMERLLGSGRFREQAVADHRIFRLDPDELRDFRAAHNRLAASPGSTSP